MMDASIRVGRSMNACSHCLHETGTVVAAPLNDLTTQHSSQRQCRRDLAYLSTAAWEGSADTSKDCDLLLPSAPDASSLLVTKGREFAAIFHALLRPLTGSPARAETCRAAHTPSPSPAPSR